MALSDADKEKIFLIMDLPKAGTGYEGAPTTDPNFGPTGEEYDFNIHVTELNARIVTADAVAARVTLIQALITDYDAIEPQSEVEVYESSGSRGVLAHGPRRIENIRQRLASLLGFYVPKGGWLKHILSRERRNRFQTGR